jgi:hypothetical protein
MGHPVRLIVIGFFMTLIGGVVLPFLMVLHILPVAEINQVLAWILIFGSYAMGIAGLFLGIIGAAMYVRTKQPPK